jgi:hypothetical protein
MRGHLWIWMLTLVASAAVFAACGGSGGGVAATPHESSTVPGASSSTTAASTTAAAQDINMTAAMFTNIHRLTKVRGFYVGNLLGHLAAALAVADNPNGGVYPVGTIIQLVPQEAMVKRRAGWSPATHDWEMFSLRASATGTTITSRGAAKTVNAFGMNCASCHEAAKPQFDFVCETTHGCAPLPLTDALIKQIQDSDPRPK